MLAYRAMILAAVLVIASVGRLRSSGLEDACQVFLGVGQAAFPGEMAEQPAALHADVPTGEF